MGYFTRTHGITVPTSTIQGREFFWVVIDANVDIETDYDTVESNFQELIRAVQQVAEIQIIGMPNGQNVTLALSMNTTPGSGQFEQGRINAVETAIEAATGWNVSVWDAQLNGDSFSYDT